MVTAPSAVEKKNAVGDENLCVTTVPRASTWKALIYVKCGL